MVRDARFGRSIEAESLEEAELTWLPDAEGVRSVRQHRSSFWIQKFRGMFVHSKLGSLSPISFHNFQFLDIRDTQVSDSDIQCFNITTSLREILMECPPNLREKASDKNPSEAVADGEAKAGCSKDIVETPAPTTTAAENAAESDIETGSEMEGEDSEEEVEVPEGANGAKEKNGNENGAAASSNQNHYIQVIIHDGNLMNVNNGHIPADQMQRARANGLRYMVGVVNGEGPAEVLQRHIEERHDALLAARIDLLRRAERQREQPPPLSRERPETREIETQTDKAEAAVSTRPNETQTDPCAKTAEKDDDMNKPSTSASVASDIGTPGPSNRGSTTENNAKRTEDAADNVELPQEVPETVEGDANDPPAREAEPEQPAAMQPNPIVEPPNHEGDLNERRQRLIIIHQRRHDEDYSAADRHR